MKKTLIYITTIFIPILIGCAIYLGFRSESLLMFRWFDVLELNHIILCWREFAFPFKEHVNKWVVYSLPDGLWMFSFIFSMLYIWDFNLNKANFFWIFIVPLIGIGIEIGQLFNIIPGTFDTMDLLVVCVGIAIPFYTLYIINQLKINKS